jgi:flagellar basal body-associated protein FliL
MIETLAIILPLVTIGFFVWFFIRSRRPRKAKKAKVDENTRQERAVWAWAKVLSADLGPVNSYRMARVALQLEVHMPGTAAYEVKTTWLVDQEAMASVETGKEISLKADPLGPEHVYPSGSWAKLIE